MITIIFVVTAWAIIATVIAIGLVLRLHDARRHVRVAIRMAADAVEHRQEMERNTPVLVLAGHPTEKLSVTKYWLN